MSAWRDRIKRDNEPDKSADRCATPKAVAGWGYHIWNAGRFSMKLLFRGVGYTCSILVVLVTVAVIIACKDLPQVSTLLDPRIRGSVTMMDRHGEVFAWRGNQFGGNINAATVSPYLRAAVVAVEDKRFNTHFGISPRGIASAIRINLREGRGPLVGHGGSTITQQTAKLLCIGEQYDPSVWPTEAAYEAECRENSLWRKAREAIFALALEARYSKDEILSIYLNRAYLGAGTVGFEAASQRYFDKRLADVSPAEAAMLAGLLTAPSRYAPTADLQRSQDRAKVVIGLMAAQGYLSQKEAESARANPAQLSETAAKTRGTYFADWLWQNGPDFLTRNTTEDVAITTTFDPRIQQAAEDALAHVYENNIDPESEVQAAIIVMSADGAVRAMVGGRKFDDVEGQFNRGLHAKRQTGSAFKPFIYAAALDMGYSPLDTIVDEPITIRTQGAPSWSPRNFTRRHYGRVTLGDALSRSLNIPVVKLSQEIGLEAVRAVAEGFGIKSDLAAGAALVLGVSEASLLEMTGAYAGILNSGNQVIPYGMSDMFLRGEHEPLIRYQQGVPERVISENAAAQLTYMLHDAIVSGTGRRARIPGVEVAGKTGTTQSNRDAWFLGFSADYVVGVWMGHDDNRPLRGITGSGLPAEIWRETMVRVQSDAPARPLPMIAATPKIPTIEQQNSTDWYGLY